MTAAIASVRKHRPPAWLGGRALVGLGLTVELGSLFVRTIILARLLGPREFGIAAAINTLGAVIDMISFLGLDRYLVFAKDGAGPAALAAAHTLTLARGCISAGITILLAWPVARLVQAGQLGPEFALLAVVPFLRGWVHLGVFQMQRAHRFAPAATAEAAAALAGLGVSAVCAWRHPDHSALLWGLIAQGAVAVLVSHLASRPIPYSLGTARAPRGVALRFGLPLAWNGAVLAASSQLDRMMVGGWLGPAALGLYGLGATLLMQPVNLLMRFATTAWQPGLSACWHAGHQHAFATLADKLSRAAAAAGGAAACTIACLGAPALSRVFGAGYVTNDVFCALFAGLTGLRLLRGAMNLFGLAAGATADLAICNSASVACLPLMAIALALYPGLEAAAAGGFAGEVFALCFTHYRLRRRYGGACDAALRTALLAGLMLAGIAVWAHTLHPALSLRAGVALAAAAALGLPASLRQMRPNGRSLACLARSLLARRRFSS